MGRLLVLLVLTNSRDYPKMILTPNVTLIMAITLKLTVAVRTLGQSLLGQTSVQMLASAKMVGEGGAAVTSDLAGDARECRLPPTRLYLSPNSSL